MSLINDKRRIIKELKDIKETIDCGTEDEYKKIIQAFKENRKFFKLKDESFIDFKDEILLNDLELYYKKD